MKNDFGISRGRDGVFYHWETAKIHDLLYEQLTITMPAPDWVLLRRQGTKPIHQQSE